MCKVKAGKYLQNKQDVQNLIIGIINRQQKTYDRGTILSIAKHYCKGSNLELNIDTLQNIIDDNLDFLYRKGLIDCRNGYYYPQHIFSENVIK